MTTRKILVERIHRILDGGTVTTNSRYSKAQIAYELNGVIAKLLKSQVYEGFAEGGTAPDGCIIATYENVPIDRRDNGRSSAQLPVTPMRMPRNMGVFSVYPSGRPELEYIPIEPGMTSAINNDRLLSPLGPQCYTYFGNRVYINDDAVGRGVTSLDMLLCVVDIMSLGDNDPLPAPADIEADAVSAVVSIMSGEPLTERGDTKVSTPTKSDAR